MKSIQKKWTFTCPKCQTENECITNFSMRLPDDKATVKRINTHVGCGNCGEITLIENIDEVLGIEFDWKARASAS